MGWGKVFLSVSTDSACRLFSREDGWSTKKPILLVGLVLVCIAAVSNFLLFMISLPGGPGNQQQIDWVEFLTSSAPAYLPWKIIDAICIVGLILMIYGVIADRKK